MLTEPFTDWLDEGDVTVTNKSDPAGLVVDPPEEPEPEPEPDPEPEPVPLPEPEPVPGAHI